MIALHDSLSRKSDLETLIARYACAAPRYTSYPPANRFEPMDDGADWLEDALQETEPLSLYVHLPFCSTQCHYCGCHSLITRDSGRADDYLVLLAEEIANLRTRLAPEREVIQLHLGGGTPNFLNASQLWRLNDMLLGSFRFAPDAEIGIEVDPRVLEEDQAEVLASFGYNRVSFGVQDCEPAVQKAIHRVQPHALNERAVTLFRRAGIRSVNIDLIYGLPLQSRESFRETVERVLALAPDRLSLFQYAHVPWMKPHQRALERYGLPDSGEKLAIFVEAVERLEEAGYVHIGLDHFARSEDELAEALEAGTLQRNFQGYSTRAGAAICGLGISSISSSSQGYWQNEKDLKAYEARLADGELPIVRGYRLSEEDKRRQQLIHAVMCQLGLDFESLACEAGIDLRADYPQVLEALEPMVADGLLERDAAGLWITRRGRYFLRNIASCFDQGLQSQPGRYSTTH